MILTFCDAITASQAGSNLCSWCVCHGDVSLQKVDLNYIVLWLRSKRQSSAFLTQSSLLEFRSQEKYWHSFVVQKKNIATTLLWDRCNVTVLCAVPVLQLNKITFISLRFD